MNLKKRKTRKFILLIIMMMVFTSLVACGGREDAYSEEDTFTIVYDGNGGYLGNKTYTIRKLQVEEDSKLPKYLSEYDQDPYVVSSLGLAIRAGYELQGWYLQENASYDLNPMGSYVYLDYDLGNGAYQVDEAGDYVYGYLEDEAGAYVFIYVEELGEDDDPEATEYIYFEGSSGYGFYIYDDGNGDHFDIYQADGGYSTTFVVPFGTSYLEYDELSVTHQTLFEDVPRYVKAFYEYTANDEGLTRFAFAGAYVQTDTMMVEDELGDYALDGANYVLFDSEDPLQADLVRFSIDDRYVFNVTDTNTSPSELEKYSASYIYWDFENDRVAGDMILYAHWEKKLTVEYIQLSGQVTEITGKLSEDNTTTIDFVAGETIGKLETIPLYAGYTFVNWSTSETEYIPWDFETDVFPSGISTLKLYAYMIEGTYTRIKNASNLEDVADDPDGNYLLVNDIDLGGQIYNNSSPLGFVVKTTIGSSMVPFTGTFVSLGNKISNYTIAVYNTQKIINSDLGISAVLGLFPSVQNATIDGLTIEGSIIVFNTAHNATSVVCELGAAGLIGTALAGTTTVNNVSVTVTISSSSDDVIDYPVSVGDIVAIGEDNVTITNSTATFDYSGITGITTSTLSVQTLE
jgi:hypothetical protein